MADELSVMLFWFADYSSFYSVLTVVVCFIVMVVFILRLNNENIFMNLNSTSVQQVNLAVERCVTDMVNPFSVKIWPGELSSLKDGLHIQLSLLKKCILQVYWGIDLEEFHKAMQAPWQHILLHLRAKSWLEGYILFRNENKELNPCDSRHEHFQCPEEMSADALGELPRKKYPAMVITYLPGSSEENNSTNPKIVAVFSIIHLKDNICQQDSHILSQYMKTSNQGVFTLQPLFISTSPESQTNHTSSQPITQSNKRSTTDPHSSSQMEETDKPQHPDSVQQSQVLSRENEAYVHSSDAASDENVPGTCSKCEKTTVMYKDLCAECYREATVGTDPVFISESGNKLCDGQKLQGVASRSECQDTLLSQNGHPSRDFSNSDQDEEECIVCQAELLAFALLPCRHACVCQSCFRQIDRCPICRGYIESYFRVRGSNMENIETVEDTLTDSEISSAHGSMWERINSKLNTFFGFS
ncbi:cell growth regulator with RING finger domain protein 1-like [Pecten maximus]|uniref:cell growth regulator with RING finger domain protein 1-like n=1 Tax=Pecten maximus TaxID=6579 RepID=UPI0014590F80|nr:cell growth regulator with RING finger domain protein 1-like [Pecten maximus]